MNQSPNIDLSNQPDSVQKNTEREVAQSGSILEYLKDRHDNSPDDEEGDTFLSQKFLNVAANKHFSQSIPRRESPQAEFQLDPNLAHDDASLEDIEDEEDLADKQITYTKLIIENDKLISGTAFSYEYPQVAGIVLQLLDIRDKYIFPLSEYTNIPDLIEFKAPSSEPIINYLKDTALPEKLQNVELKNINGAIVPHINGEPICTITSATDYVRDLTHLLTENYNRSTRNFCNKKLNLLSEKFNMHLLFNREKEFFEQKVNIHRDFYNIRKVDNLLDHASAASVGVFLSFVKEKFLSEKNTEVIIDQQTKKPFTLEQVLETYNLKQRVLTIEDLEVRNYFLETLPHIHRESKKAKQQSRNSVIGEVFLQWDNMLKGRFLAELTHELFKEYKKYKFQVSELRISVYGKDRGEWDRLQNWFNTYKIYDQRVRWIVQIPQLYKVFRKQKNVQNVQEMLDNIFQPLFEVTIDPSSNPGLHKVLLTVVGFDALDDETGYHETTNAKIFRILPSQFDREHNPHFCYWLYYIWANLYALNHLRKMRGLNTFAFRPHVSETATAEYLMSAYLLAHGISRGGRLRKSPLLQYLFYLKQIGISMSPLSENKLFLKYKDNPFPTFFARGLNVSLSTDHPLLYHMTNQPLIEEYSITAQVFDLNACDLCELARNSIIQCGFESVIKKYWIGEEYDSKGTQGNDYEKTNVPTARYSYRIETLLNEHNDLKYLANTILNTPY